MSTRRLLLLAGLLLAAAATARAQISVSMSIKDRFHILHEPIVATAVVTNLTGRDITLTDSAQFQWFGFRITTSGDRLVAPRDLRYKLPPLPVKAGETVKRSVDLHQLYNISDFGTYRVEATIYFEGLDKFFVSRPTHIEITEGRTIWRKTAGIPDGQPGGGQMRVFSLLAHQRGEVNTLYVRVEDKDRGAIYCTMPLGRLLEHVPPQAEFDSNNNLYVLQLVGNRAYTLSKITSNGEFVGRTNYSAPKSRPTLRKTADGALQIIGGRREVEIAQTADSESAPKLSDRPAGLPSN